VSAETGERFGPRRHVFTVDKTFACQYWPPPPRTRAISRWLCTKYVRTFSLQLLEYHWSTNICLVERRILHHVKNMSVNVRTESGQMPKVTSSFKSECNLTNKYPCVWPEYTCTRKRATQQRRTANNSSRRILSICSSRGNTQRRCLRSARRNKAWTGKARSRITRELRAAQNAFHQVKLLTQNVHAIKMQQEHQRAEHSKNRKKQSIKLEKEKLRKIEAQYRPKNEREHKAKTSDELSVRHRPASYSRTVKSTYASMPVD
jgi:hypothetical protein